MSSVTVDLGRPSNDDRIPRCCPSHTDWSTLGQHLVADFPDLSAGATIRELRVARDAVEIAGLRDAEALETAELIARHQLRLLAGHVTDMARLDPERHERR